MNDYFENENENKIKSENESTDLPRENPIADKSQEPLDLDLSGEFDNLAEENKAEVGENNPITPATPIAPQVPPYNPINQGYSQRYQQGQNYRPAEFSPQQSPYYYPNSSYNQNYQPTPNRPKKSSKGIITFTVLLVACVVIASVAMIFALDNSNKNIHQNNPSHSDTNNNDSTDNNSQEKIITSNDIPEGTDKNSVVAGEISSTAQVATKIAPSVVAITVGSGYSQTAGSGFIVSQDGYIVTNYHVVENADNSRYPVSISVLLDGGDEYTANYIAGDSRNDIAVIKIDATGLSAAEIGKSDQLLRGDFVMAVGNPLGEFQGSVSLGVVSGTGRVGIDSSAIPYIQTDAAINPGNSGGPLVNMYGQVVGINTAKVVISGYEGIGFAIPMAYAENIINELISTRKAPSYAFIGIQYTAITQTQSEYYNIPVGLRIEAIYDQSKIDRSVVQVGDIITEVDGEKIDSTTILTKILSEKKPGDTIKVKLYRSNRGIGNEYETTITLISSNDID